MMPRKAAINIDVRRLKKRWGKKRRKNEFRLAIILSFSIFIEEVIEFIII
jgi:predicted metal-dependent hydrolase